MTVRMQVVKELSVILLLSAVLALGVNALRTDGLSLFSSTGSSETDIAANTAADSEASRSIGIEAAIAHFRNGDALFIDARPFEDYRRGHIKGALNLPDHAFDEWIADFMQNTPPDRRLITYCAGESCHLSSDLAEKLQMAGYEQAIHLVDGWGKWRAAGMPTEVDPQQ